MSALVVDGITYQQPMLGWFVVRPMFQVIDETVVSGKKQWRHDPARMYCDWCWLRWAAPSCEPGLHGVSPNGVWP